MSLSFVFQGSTVSRLARSLRTGAALFAMVCLAVPARADSFSVGIVPQFEARKLADIWLPILAELEERTGHSFTMAGSSDISDFERSFLEGAFDFAYMNPYHLLKAHESQGYAPLVRDGSRRLSGILVARADGPVSEVADLEGKRIVFPSPNALGASLLMRAELARTHGLTYDPVYASTHTSAYLNVVLGEADAAGGVMGTFRSLDESLRDKLRIIYETSSLTPHPLAVHPRIAEDVAEAVRDALVDMGDDERTKPILARVPFQSVVAASFADYESLIELNLDDYWVSE